MALRYQAVRGPRTEVEVWRCLASPIHAGAACYALLPTAREPDTCIGRYGLLMPIEQELRQAEAAVEHCRRHAARQRAEAERRERVGHDSSHARGLSQTFQWLEVEHAAHRDRLMAELAQAARTSS